MRPPEHLELPARNEFQASLKVNQLLCEMIKSILVVVVATVLTMGCSSQKEAGIRKTELIREIEAIQEKIDQKRDFTSIFTAGPPKRPENLAKMEIKELEAARRNLQALNVLLDAPASQSSELTEQEVIEIARKAVQAKYSCTNWTTFSVNKSAGTWLVHVSPISSYDKDGNPKVEIGNDISITIDCQGHVKKYQGGM